MASIDQVDHLAIVIEDDDGSLEFDACGSDGTSIDLEFTSSTGAAVPTTVNPCDGGNRYLLPDVTNLDGIVVQVTARSTGNYRILFGDSVFPSLTCGSRISTTGNKFLTVDFGTNSVETFDLQLTRSSSSVNFRQIGSSSTEGVDGVPEPNPNGGGIIVSLPSSIPADTVSDIVIRGSGPFTLTLDCTLSSGGGGGGFFCFPGQSKIVTKDRGEVPIKDAKIGDKVLTKDGIFQTIYGFGHLDRLGVGTFLELILEGKTEEEPLVLSENHMLPVVEKGTIPASLVEVGDRVTNSEGHQVAVAGIKKQISKVGMYAPFTASGTIVVDEIVVSCYVAFQESEAIHIGGWKTPITYQWLAHTFTFPRRVYCNFWNGGACTGESYAEDGIATWLANWHKAAVAMMQPETNGKEENKNHGLLLYFVLLLAVPVACIFTVLDSVPTMWWTTCTLAVVCGVVGCQLICDWPVVAVKRRPSA